jgi:hypothetical protein
MEPEGSFLNEVEKWKAPVRVVLCYRDNEPEMRLNEPISCPQVALSGSTRQRGFFTSSHEWNLCDAVEIEPYGVVVRAIELDRRDILLAIERLPSGVELGV